MQKIIITIFIINFFLVFAEGKIPVEVLKVYDGDTVRVKLENGNKFSIRLQGIDCYETSKINRAYKQAYTDKLNIDEVVEKGINAKEYLENLHKKSKKASFDFEGVDIYGRVLGIVWFDEINLNETMLNNNYCKPYEFREK